jgi:hypothetical protein
MITKIWINNSCKSIDFTYMPELTADINDIMVQFDTQEACDAFAAIFPKSVNVKQGHITGYFYDESAKRLDFNRPFSHPYAAVWIMPTKKGGTGKMNKVTGALNEGGVKRLERFYTAIKKELGKNK